MTIFALKLKDPSAVFLNRGNHEMLETNILCLAAKEVSCFNEVRLLRGVWSQVCLVARASPKRSVSGQEEEEESNSRQKATYSLYRTFIVWKVLLEKLHHH